MAKRVDEQPKTKVFLRKPEVAKRTGRSRSSIDRDEALGLFPKRFKLGARAVGWLEHEVDAWIDAREHANGGEAA